MKLLRSSVFCLGTSCRAYQIVLYWGQNGAGSQGLTYEQDLSFYCERGTYDTIVLAFLHVFFDPRNKDSYPSINFANHCGDTFAADGYPLLLRCPQIGTQVKGCQQKGIKLLLSLGGASGTYGFPSQAKAVEFAKTVWNLFLGGTSNVRPFGDAILDGVDLDIEGGSINFYPDFVREIRRIMNASKVKSYIIAGAPQCPYPDAYLGPGVGKALTEVGEEFDQIYVQFYNNWCYLDSGTLFAANVKQWFDLAQEIRNRAGRGPTVFIGLPAHPKASGMDKYFISESIVQQKYEIVKSNPSFGGFMFWDASFDMNSAAQGLFYSARIKSVLSGKVPVISPLPPAALTKPAAVTVPLTTSPTQESRTRGPPALPQSCAHDEEKVCIRKDTLILIVIVAVVVCLSIIVVPALSKPVNRCLDKFFQSPERRDSLVKPKSNKKTKKMLTHA